MKLTFFGGAGEVTGSCLRVAAGSLNFLVDCGLFQGAMRGPDNAPARNRAAYARDLGELDFVLLTHAHLDHSGLLPRFAAARARAPLIWCTKPTADLLPVMLKDSAHIQSREANRPRGRRGRAPATEAPLYTSDDVDRLATRLIGVPYGAQFRPHPAASVRLRSAGHIVGAAFAEVELVDGRGRKRRLTVSGDLGEASPLLVSEREARADCDVLVVESTYGNRNHRPLADTEDEREALERFAADILGRVSCPGEPPAGPCLDFGGRRLLCVGGRANLVAQYRALVERAGGVFEWHDGGREEAVSRLPDLLARQDAVICPADCVSHSAYYQLKRYCKLSGTPCLMLKGSGLGSFAEGLRRLAEGRVQIGADQLE